MFKVARLIAGLVAFKIARLIAGLVAFKVANLIIGLVTFKFANLIAALVRKQLGIFSQIKSHQKRFNEYCSSNLMSFLESDSIVGRR